MKKAKDFMRLAQSQLGMFIVALVIVVALFAAAVIFQKIANKKQEEKVSLTKKLTLTGMFAALAAVLMYIEFPLWFAPADIYKLDFSEIPVLVCGFILGPVAGIACEFVKILIKLIIKPTSTAFVGEFANFVIGCSFVVPASIIYHLKKTRIYAVIGMVVGTIVMATAGSLLNALFLLPVFSVFYGMPIEVIVSFGTKLNSKVTNIFTFAAFIVAPFNLIKGVLVSIVTFLIYKPISYLLKIKL